MGTLTWLPYQEFISSAAPTHLHILFLYLFDHILSSPPAYEVQGSKDMTLLFTTAYPVPGT